MYDFFLTQTKASSRAVIYQKAIWHLITTLQKDRRPITLLARLTKGNMTRSLSLALSTFEMEDGCVDTDDLTVIRHQLRWYDTTIESIGCVLTAANMLLFINKPYSEKYGSVEAELIARVSHDHPIFGDVPRRYLTSRKKPTELTEPLLPTNVARMDVVHFSPLCISMLEWAIGKVPSRHLRLS